MNYLSISSELIQEVKSISLETMKLWIISCLKLRGGKCLPDDVAKYVWENYETELRNSRDILYTWQYDLRKAAQQLRDEGILKAVNGRNDLPWELANAW